MKLPAYGKTFHRHFVRSHVWKEMLSIILTSEKYEVIPLKVAMLAQLACDLASPSLNFLR